jgi:uncharacterized protein (DUF433 family)
MPSRADEIITKDPEVLGGTPVFRGTRVPFQSFLDYRYWANCVLLHLVAHYRIIWKLDKRWTSSSTTSLP